MLIFKFLIINILCIIYKTYYFNKVLIFIGILKEKINNFFCYITWVIFIIYIK